MMRSAFNDGSPGGVAGKAGEKRTQRVLNVRLLVGTIAAVAILTPIALAWHSYQERRTADAFLRRAMSELLEWGNPRFADDDQSKGDRRRFDSRMVTLLRAEDQALDKEARRDVDWRTVDSYLYRYLNKNPDYVPAQFWRAIACDLSGNWGTAIRLYYDAVPSVLSYEREDGGEDLRRRLAELLYLAAQFGACEDEAQKLLDSDENDVRALRLKALALYGQHKLSIKRDTPVIEAFDEALEADPKNASLATVFAQICRNEASLFVTEKSSALKAFKRICPAAYETAKKKLKAQQEDLTDATLEGLLADTAVDRELMADTVIDNMVAADPENAQSYLVRFGYRTGYNLPGAEADLLTALRKDPDDLIVRLAAAGHARSEPTRLAQILDQYLKKTEAGEEPDRQKLHERIVQLFSASYVRRDPANLGQAVETYLNQIAKGGEPDRQKLVEDFLDQPALLEPFFADYDRLKAFANEAPSDRQAAQTVLVAYVTTCREEENRHYQHALEIDSSSAAAYLALADLYLRQQKSEEAIRTLQDGLKKCGEESIEDSFKLNFVLAKTLIGARRLNDAWNPDAKPGDKVAEEKPLYRLGQAIEKLGLEMPRQNQTARIRTAQIRSTWKAQYDLLRGSWFFSRTEFRRAIPLLKQVTAIQDVTILGVSDAVRAWMRLGSSYDRLAQWDQAASAFEKAASLQPRILVPRLKAARAWLNSGRPDEAIRHYRQALSIRGGDSPETWLSLAEARFRQQVGVPSADRDWEPFQTALKNAKDDKRQPPLENAWRINLLEAGFAQVSGEEREERTLERLREAESEYPSSTGLLQQLVLRYDRLGSPEDADRALEKLGQLGMTSAGLSSL
ncbi:MAG: tetratricopeptide repeat protein, partial [Planctomycetota bacterium]